jgi:hypothetical protein
MYIMPTKDFLIRFFTQKNDKEVQEYVELLDSGEISLWIPTILVLQTLEELTESYRIPIRKVAKAWIQLIQSGCVDMDERDTIIKTLDEISMDIYATNPFDIYLSFKAQEINAFKMPSREYNPDVPLRSVLQELKRLMI